jgi:preprotein translocase subunit SecE
MARDRKRAKQRQRQRRAQQQRQPTRARDAREKQSTDDPGIGAPDPLQDASADVEIAEEAERAIETLDGPGTPLKEEEYPQRDELEGADVLEEERQEEREQAEEALGAPRRPRAAGPGAALPKEGNRFANFLRACVAELRRVQWPDRRAVGQATGVVLGFVLIAGGYLGVLDAIFSRLVNAIL